MFLLWTGRKLIKVKVFSAVGLKHTKTLIIKNLFTVVSTKVSLILLKTLSYNMILEFESIEFLLCPLKGIKLQMMLN